MLATGTLAETCPSLCPGYVPCLESFSAACRGFAFAALWLACSVLAILVVPCRADQTHASETLIRLTVAPAPVPKPALRVLCCLPDLSEMSPGNPIQHYMKSCMEEQSFFFDKAALRAPRAAPGHAAPRAARLGAPGIRPVRARGGRPGRPARQPRLADLEQAQGRRRTACCSRKCSRCAALPRAPGARSEPRLPRAAFDDAVRTAKTMFAMARHLGEHPTFIGELVGIAIAAVDHRPARRNARAAGLPQPLLGAHQSAQPVHPSRQRRRGRAHLPDRGSFAIWMLDAPMTASRSKRSSLTRTKLLDIDDNRARRSRVAGRADQGPRAAPRRPRPPGRERLPGGALAQISARASDPARREARVLLLASMTWSSSLPCRPGRPKKLLEPAEPEEAAGLLCRRLLAGLPVRQAGAGANRPADRAIAARRGAAALRRGAPRGPPREAVRDHRAAARRPVHRQAVSL